ncbi:MAG TPA: FapA family protein [Fibrobacteria bacterium]|nr:FapA family protein [Fibrobacteria bacterium]
MIDPSQGFAFLRTLFHWRLMPDGAYIRVLPDAQEANEQDVFRAFLAAGILNANAATICSMIRQKQEGWQRVGKAFEFRDETVSPVLQVRNENLVGSIRIDPAMAREQGREVTVEEIRNLLAGAGIVQGVDDDVLQMLLRPNCATGWFDVAVGDPAQDGTDAVLECRVQIDQSLPVPDEAGTMDFRDRGHLPEVRAGTPIYVRIPGLPAVDGKGLDGKVLPARQGRDITLPVIENGRIREGDPNVLEASCDGYLYLGRDGRIQVGREFKVKGDLDLSVGNIRYHGPVEIGGNVPTGFQIHAGGDITILGTAEGSDIHSFGGGIHVRGGVFGGKLQAATDIKVSFAHEATLTAGSTVEGGKYLQHCRVRCTTLHVAPGGMFVGGQVLASREIECDVLGTEAGTPTIVQLSDPEEEDARSDLEKVNLEIKKFTPMRDQLEQKVVALKNRIAGGGVLLGRAREDAEESLRQYAVVVERMRECERRKAHDQEILASDRERIGSITVRRTIHPGVEVHIFGRRFEIDSVRAPVRLHVKDREVEVHKV